MNCSLEVSLNQMLKKNLPYVFLMIINSFNYRNALGLIQSNAESTKSIMTHNRKEINFKGIF